MADQDRRPPVLATPAPSIDPAQVAQAYGLGEVVGALEHAARGELGRIWHLPTSTGEWAVKELFTEVSEEEAADDVAFQLAALRAGVTMPTPRRRLDGDVLSQVVGPDGSGTLVRVYSWVDLAPGPEPGSAAQAAEQLGRLHATPFPDTSDADPWFWEPVDDASWSALLEAARRSGAGWATALEAVVPELVAANAVVRAGGYTPTVRCHLDLNPQNVLRAAGGHAVVVDWENSGPATVEQELASTIAEFVRDPGDLPAFCQAYLAAGGPRVRLERASFTMTLAVQAHLLTWYVGRAVDPAVDPEDRARAAFWTADICSLLFTVGKVDAWVNAARTLLG